MRIVEKPILYDFSLNRNGLSLVRIDGISYQISPPRRG